MKWRFWARSRYEPPPQEDITDLLRSLVGYMDAKGVNQIQIKLDDRREVRLEVRLDGWEELKRRTSDRDDDFGEVKKGSG